MLLLPYSLAASCLLSISLQEALAVPNPTVFHQPRSIPLLRRAVAHDTDWLHRQKLRLESKYGGRELQTRASGFNLLVNQGNDSSFYGSLAVGTPAISYNVILDTGSSDLWLAASNGITPLQDSIPLFDPSVSSTFKSLNVGFQINYGSGAARGTLGQDVVQMAGFEVSNQIFGVVTQVSNDLLQNPVSGLLGLGFQSIAASGAKPFWQTLATSGSTLDEPIMGFQLTRFVNSPNAQVLEPGGTFTLGAVNNTLLTGDVDYQPIPDGEVGYWIQELTDLTVNGASIALPSGSASYAAIDTGTTLVGGPVAAISAIYAQIPGSQPLNGQNQGYFTYPCDTQVTVSMKYGNSSIAWPINPADFELMRLSRKTCVGGFFALDTAGTSAPAWIVGDVFLKNVYSVYRAGSTPAVGFAKLSDTALAMNGRHAPVPSPTVGSVAATVMNGASAPALASVSVSLGAWLGMLLFGLVGGAILL